MKVKLVKENLTSENILPIGTVLTCVNPGVIQIIEGDPAMSADVKEGDEFIITNNAANDYYYFGKLKTKGGFTFKRDPGLSGKRQEDLEKEPIELSKIVYGIDRKNVNGEYDDFWATFVPKEPVKEPINEWYDEEYYEKPQYRKGMGEFEDIDWKVLHELLMDNKLIIVDKSVDAIPINVGDLTDYDGWLSLEELKHLEDFNLIEIIDNTFPVVENEEYYDFNIFKNKAKEIWNKEMPISKDVDPYYESPYLRGREVSENLNDKKSKEDPTRGLGENYPMFKNAIKKIPFRKIEYTISKIEKSEYYKNLTDNEIREFAALINVPFHSTFSMYDLKAYYKQLSDSRNLKRKKVNENYEEDEDDDYSFEESVYQKEKEIEEMTSWFANQIIPENFIDDLDITKTPEVNVLMDESQFLFNLGGYINVNKDFKEWYDSFDQEEKYEINDKMIEKIAKRFNLEW